MFYELDYPRSRFSQRLAFIAQYYDYLLKSHLTYEKQVGVVSLTVSPCYDLDQISFEKKQFIDSEYKLLPAATKCAEPYLGVSWFYCEIKWLDTDSTWYFKHPYPKYRVKEFKQVFGDISNN